jgi:opacity protein-like surface antigen
MFQFCKKGPTPKHLSEEYLMRLCVLFCSVALFAIPAATTFSQDSMGSDSGLSIAAGGGVMFLSEISDVKIETTFEKDGESVDQKHSVELEDAAFELGWSVDGALGYQFGGIRAEAEFSYLSVNQNKIGETELKAEDYDALPQLTAMSFMANGWYELDTGTPFSPFIGIGLGAANLSWSGGTLKGAPDEFEPTESTGWGFAYQAGAGLGVEVADGFSIRLGYRLFGTLETTLTSETESADNPIYDTAIGTVAFPMMAHRIELGIGYVFPL